MGTSLEGRLGASGVGRVHDQSGAPGRHAPLDRLDLESPELGLLRELLSRFKQLEQRVAPPDRTPFLSIAELADRWRCDTKEARIRCRRLGIAVTRPGGARSDLVELRAVKAAESRRTEIPARMQRGM